MIMVSVSTFSWSSLRDLVRHPRLSSTVMLVTVLVVVLTHDLAAGVACGVLLSGLFFSFQVMTLLKITDTLSPDGITRTYYIHGQVFLPPPASCLTPLIFRTRPHTSCWT